MKLLLIMLLGEMNSFDIITLQSHKSSVSMLISYMFEFSQRPQTSFTKEAGMVKGTSL